MFSGTSLCCIAFQDRFRSHQEKMLVFPFHKEQFYENIYFAYPVSYSPCLARIFDVAIVEAV